MSKHNETGLKGEQIAENFLLQKGYAILHRNWRSGKTEVDIVALKAGIVIIVEVKTRNRDDFGLPEDFVTKTKQRHLKNAAAAFLDAFPQYLKIQFDIISISTINDVPTEIVHFDDAFY